MFKEGINILMLNNNILKFLSQWNIMRFEQKK
jgi:hypothetical protein